MFNMYHQSTISTFLFYPKSIHTRVVHMSFQKYLPLLSLRYQLNYYRCLHQKLLDGKCMSYKYKHVRNCDNTYIMCPICQTLNSKTLFLLKTIAVNDILLFRYFLSLAAFWIQHKSIRLSCMEGCALTRFLHITRGNLKSCY